MLIMQTKNTAQEDGVRTQKSQKCFGCHLRIAHFEFSKVVSYLGVSWLIKRLDLWFRESNVRLVTSLSPMTFRRTRGRSEGGCAGSAAGLRTARGRGPTRGTTAQGGDSIDIVLSQNLFQNLSQVMFEGLRRVLVLTSA